jgi:[ribosomal protein S18]-alanine N-acetyltransferase
MGERLGVSAPLREPLRRRRLARQRRGATSSGVEFLVRAFESADFACLCAIEQRCFPPGIAFPPDVLAGFIGQANAFALVAEGDGRPDATPGRETWVAGFLIGEKLRRTVGRIVALDVTPEMRRRGVASGLLAAGEERLRQVGCRQVHLETAVTNEPALALYRRHGYLMLATLPDYYPSHALDAYRLGKRLAAPGAGRAASS